MSLGQQPQSFQSFMFARPHSPIQIDFTHLAQFGSVLLVLARFGSFWVVVTNIDIWVVLGRFARFQFKEIFWLVLAEFGWVWLVLARFGSFWLGLGRFGSVWLGLGQF